MSPDGQTIVFDLLGDLYTMPITGGKATQLTSGMAFDAQPRFSPDGETVAFISDRSGGDNLWTIQVDLTDTTRITQGNRALYLSPEWTADGQYILVSRSGGLGGAAKLQMYHVDRRAPLPVITAPAPLKTVGAAVTPDDRHIWYAGRLGDWQYNALFPQYQLYRYDRELGTSTLMSNRYGSGFRPAISPDGEWLVYGTRDGTETGLRKRNLATGDEEWLAYPVQRDEMESRAPLDVLPGYSFTPDSENVIVSYGGKIWSVPMAGGPATEIPFEVDVELGVGPEVKFSYAVDTTAMVTASQIRSPVTSPDGSMVAFTAFDRLWVKTMPDGEARRLTDQDVGEFHPVWSPDGAWVGYVTWDDQNGGHLMKVPAAGGAPVQLSDMAALYYNPAWSPDGNRIVATMGAARQLKEASGIFFGPIGGQFVWVPSDGGTVNTISHTGFRDVAHFVDDNSDRIYAYSPAEGLVSFRWDGTDVERHLRVMGAPIPGANTPHPDELEFLPRRVFPYKKVDDPTGLTQDPAAEPPGPPPAGLVMISPTGEQAFAQVGSDIYVVDMARVGTRPPTVMVANPQAAPLPVRKLTDVGGEFPAWTPDGSALNWALGNVLFTYDIAGVEAEEEAAEEMAHGMALVRVRVAATLDSLKTKRAEADSLEKADEEVSDSLQTEITRLAADSIQIAADTLVAKADSIRAAAEKIVARADSVRSGNEEILADSTDTYEAREQTIEVMLPRDVPRGTVVLRGGRVITMDGDSIVENADVVVTDNRIVAVGTSGEVEVPEGAEIVDVSGKTVMPGFVDVHYHSMWLVPEIHPQQVWQYLTNVAYGVTTTRDPQTAFTDVLSYADRVETGGMIGPRVYSTGPGVFFNTNIRDADHAKSILRRYAKYFDTKTLKMYMTGNRQQRQWVIQAAKELEIMPTTEGGLDFKIEMTHAIDGYPGIEHSLPIAPIYSDVVELFKTSQTTNTPTLLVSYGGPFGENWFYTNEDVHDDPKLRHFIPEDNIDARSRRRGTNAGGSPGPGGWFLDEEYVFEKHAEFIRDLVADSGRAGVGSHGQLQGLGFHWELWAMGSGGASNHDVLKMGTILGAEAIGMGADLGSIEEGKLADILVLDGDPLEDLRASTSLRYVMMNGRLYDADTLDEMWPTARPLPEQPWRSFGPNGVNAGIATGN